jgi:hypothetical protein
MGSAKGLFVSWFLKIKTHLTMAAALLIFR